MSTISTVKRPKNRFRVFGCALCLGLIAAPAPALAIPPPDVIVNAGLQIAQAVGVAAFFCSTGIAYLFRRFRSVFDTPAKKFAMFALIFGGFALAWYLVWGF